MKHKESDIIALLCVSPEKYKNTDGKNVTKLLRLLAKRLVIRPA
jgi:hypothetical protein